MLFITAILFGPKKGALAGAIGMGLFDVLGGWLIWAPTTIISRALQGFIVGKIAWSMGHRGDNIGLNILAAVVSMPVMMAVYYVGQGLCSIAGLRHWHPFQGTSSKTLSVYSSRFLYVSC